MQQLLQVTKCIMFAVKHKLDMYLGVAIGSSTQIPMFVIPICVVAGWIMGQPMDLNFQPFKTAILFVTVLIIAHFLQDGTMRIPSKACYSTYSPTVGLGFFVDEDPSSTNWLSSELLYFHVIDTFEL